MEKNYWKGQDLDDSTPGRKKAGPRVGGGQTYIGHAKGYYGESEENADLCEFGTVYEECVFCGQPRTIRFDEHYNFCPNCKAIYTTMILQESGCEHVVDGTPLVVQEPWDASYKNSEYIRWKNDTFIRVLQLSKFNSTPKEPDQYFCSVCSQKCVVDGW